MHSSYAKGSEKATGSSEYQLPVGLPLYCPYGHVRVEMSAFYVGHLVVQSLLDQFIAQPGICVNIEVPVVIKACKSPHVWWQLDIPYEDIVHNVKSLLNLARCLSGGI